MATMEHSEKTSSQLSALEHLDSNEAREVLRRMLSAHAELREAAEGTARALLAEKSAEATANAIEQVIGRLEIRDMGPRVGYRNGRYVEPADAGWEILTETAAPFLFEIKRLKRLGLTQTAANVCEGVLIGLYRLRNPAKDSMLIWEPEFLVDAACKALALLHFKDAGSGSVFASREKPVVLSEQWTAFLRRQCPEWADVIQRKLKR